MLARAEIQALRLSRIVKAFNHGRDLVGRKMMMRRTSYPKRFTFGIMRNRRKEMRR